MKDYALILFKNNTSIKKRIKNPQKYFEAEYLVDNKKQKKKYQYDRSSTIIMPTILKLKARMSFYEEGNPKPLNPNFTSPAVNMEEISDMINTSLIGNLADSTKDKGVQLSMTMVFGLAGIAAIVIIAIFG